MNKIYRLIYCQKGSVSIYFIITLGALFIFNAVLIDFARIKIAEQQTEYALRAALRSTLSAYDSKLIVYGLFAQFDRDQELNIFKKVLEHNLKESIEVHSIDLNPEASLADHTVFKQQILNDMKYTAPIQFILDLIHKFQKSGAANEMKEASTFYKLSEEMEQLIEKRERSLNRAWTEAQQLVGPNGLFAQYNLKYNHRLTEMNDRANKLVEFEIEKLDKLKMEELADWTIHIASTYTSIQLDYEPLIAKAETIKEQLNQAKDYNDQLSDTLEKNSWEFTEEEEPTQLVLDRTYFVQYELGISRSLGLFNGFKLQFDPVMLWTESDYIKQNIHLHTSNEAYREAANEFYIKQGRLEDERDLRNAEINSQKINELLQIESILLQVRNLVSDCGSTDSANFILSNLDQENQSSSPEMNLHDAEAIGGQAVRFVELMAAGLLQVRDRAYLNEYAIDKFNYRTNPSSNVFHNQEAEYLIYGLDSCMKNHGAAFAEMFGLRLATRMVEALKNPKRLYQSASPFMMVLVALAEGSFQAYEDMKKLLKGEDIELSKNLAGKVSINYKDYLRLFLLIHTQEEKLMNRMQRLIEYHTGNDFDNSMTYYEANIIVHMNMWFIPGIMRMLGYDVSGSEARIEKMMVLSY